MKVRDSLCKGEAVFLLVRYVEAQHRANDPPCIVQEMQGAAFGDGFIVHTDPYQAVFLKILFQFT